MVGAREIEVKQKDEVAKKAAWKEKGREWREKAHYVYDPRLQRRIRGIASIYISYMRHSAVGYTFFFEGVPASESRGIRFLHRCYSLFSKASGERSAKQVHSRIVSIRLYVYTDV